MERKKGISSTILGLALIAGIASPGCTPTPNKPAVARKAVVAKIRIVLSPIYNCFASKKERDQTAESRCSDKAKVKKYKDESGSFCFDCHVEKEVIQ